MKTRIIPALVIVALLAPFSSCPRTPQVSLGVWLFRGSDSDLTGLELGVDGTAQDPNPLPPEASGTFTGTKTWTQDGSTFTMTQVSGPNVRVFTGTVQSSTSIIDGTWVLTAGATGSGVWTAMKL